MFVKIDGPVFAPAQSIPSVEVSTVPPAPRATKFPSPKMTSERVLLTGNGLRHCHVSSAVAPGITGGVCRIVTITGWESDPDTFAALIVAVNVPVAVGVPEIKPIEALNPTPGGRPAAPKLDGLLVAVIR